MRRKQNRKQNKITEFVSTQEQPHTVEPWQHVHNVSQYCSETAACLLGIASVSVLHTLPFIHCILDSFPKAGTCAIRGCAFATHSDHFISPTVSTLCPDYPTRPRLYYQNFPRTPCPTFEIHFALKVLHIRGLKSPLCSCGTPPSPGWHLSDKLNRILGWRTL